MRDLNRDLEIIAKATPGEWVELDGNDGRIVAVDERYVTTVAQLDENVEPEDVTFIVEAKEGWKHAIERALKAEAEVERLRRYLKYIIELEDEFYSVKRETPIGTLARLPQWLMPLAAPIGLIFGYAREALKEENGNA